jgi:hypothetical protein
MSSKSWRYLGALGVVALALGACGSTSVVVTGTPAPKVPTATATKPAPTASPTASVAVGVITACFGADAASLHVTQVGDLLFAPVTLGGLTYPSIMLPDGTPLTQPFKMAHDNVPGAGGAGGYVDFPSSPLTNPALGNNGSKGDGFVLRVCNVSGGARHVLQGVSVRIQSFTDYSSQLNQWNWCDGSLDSHHNPTAQGCGGAVAACTCFDAQFPAGAPTVGETASATQTDGSLNAPGDGLANFPYVLAPGKAIGITVTLGAPGPGRYVFTIGVRYDGGSSPIYAPTPAPEVLLAPVAHKWDGMTCMNTPALLSQITPTAPESYYICSH